MSKNNKMEATELRLGNWINDDCQICQVEYIAAHDNWENVNPISISEEWLLKFGFEKQDEKNFKKEYYRIKIDIIIEHEDDVRVGISDGTGDLYLKYADYKYIHQLQNLHFALTGEELAFK